MTDRRRHTSIVVLAVLAALVLYAPAALAQDQTQIRFDGILNAFRDQSNVWQGVLLSAARWLFFTLAIAQFAWTNMALALRGGDISDFISANVTRILGIGIMYVFLMHSFTWSKALIKGFLQAGERAVGASAPGAESLDPAGVFQNGMIVAGSLFSQMSMWSGLDNLTLVICALVMIVCFAFLSAFMALVIAESYIIIGGSVLFLGFGGADWTSDIAKRAMMYAVSVGAKLFTMQLIVGVAMGSVITWAQTYEQDSSTSTLSLIGLVLLVTVLAKMIPELVQGILAGSSVGGGGTMLATVGAAAAASVAVGRASMAGSSGGGGAAGAAAGAGSGGGSSGGGPSGATSGAQGAASANAEAARMGSMMQTSSASPHLVQAAGHLVDAGAGVNPVAAMGPLSAIGRSDDMGAKPALPQEPAASGGLGAGSSPADGGVIRGAGAGTAPTPSAGAPASSSSAAAPNSRGNGSDAKGKAGSATGASSGAGQGASPSMSATASSGGSSPAEQSSGGGATRSLDERADEQGGASGGNSDGEHLASSQLADDSSAASALGGGSAAFGGAPQSLDDRLDAPGGRGAGASDVAESLAAATTTPLGGTSGEADRAASAADRASSAADRAASASEKSGGMDPTRMQGIKAGAAAGFLAAGPGGAVVGAALGGASAPYVKEVGAKAAKRLAAAKARFGLSNTPGDA